MFVDHRLGSVASGHFLQDRSWRLLTGWAVGGKSLVPSEYQVVSTRKPRVCVELTFLEDFLFQHLVSWLS